MSVNTSRECIWNRMGELDDPVVKRRGALVTKKRPPRILRHTAAAVKDHCSEEVCDISIQQLQKFSHNTEPPWLTPIAALQHLCCYQSQVDRLLRWHEAAWEEGDNIPKCLNNYIWTLAIDCVIDTPIFLLSDRINACRKCLTWLYLASWPLMSQEFWAQKYYEFCCKSTGRCCSMCRKNGKWGNWNLE